MSYGFHADLTKTSLRALEENNLKCIQFIPGGRLTYKCPDLQIKLLAAHKHGIEIVFHAPLCCYLIADKVQIMGATLSYLKQLDQEIRRFNEATNQFKTFKVVLHAGSTEQEGKFERALAAIYRIIEGTKYIDLCIENDVGSKNGHRIGSVLFLATLVRRFVGENPKYLDRVHVCVDTNHSWGNEETDWDVTSMEYWDQIQDVLGCIHLNCIPEECKRYAHRDRHSANLIEESGECISWLRALFLRNYSVPYITERSDIELSVKDYQYLRRNDL